MNLIAASDRAGEWRHNKESAEAFICFIPRPLPPQPALSLSMGDFQLLERASRALGRLDGLTKVIPDPYLFIYAYVRKEAVLSSQIEGTQSSLSDLMLFESQAALGVAMNDVVEVSNYIAALDHALARFREGFPLSLRLIREIHEVLLRRGRGSDRAPGEFRRSQNWIGGTRPGNAFYVPPPAHEVIDCMGQLEQYLYSKSDVPELVRVGLVHAQFESIHPFLDGNGRVGRLLITFLLNAWGILSEPILYLSLFFKQNHQQYYDLLQRVRTHGDWEGWIRFFLLGVAETAEQAVDSSRRALALFTQDRVLIGSSGRVAGSMLRVHEVLQRKPIVSTATAAALSGLTAPTVTQALERLATLGLVQEVTGRKRDRAYRYTRYLALLAEGTEPNP